jgi:hypothetical protein
MMLTSTISAQKLIIGSEIGLISSINTDYNLTDIENRRNTYYSGLNVNYNFNERLTFTTGLHYLRQGYRHKTCYIFEEGVKNELAGKLDYLIIPLALNVNFGRSNKILTTAGIYGAYNIKAVQDYPEPIGGCKIYYIEDLSDYTYDYTLGGIIGAGYRIFENDKFQINSMIKYYQGLKNASKVEEIDIKRKYSSALITVTINYKISTDNKGN